MEEEVQEVVNGIASSKEQMPGVLDVKIGKVFANRGPHNPDTAVVALADKEEPATYDVEPTHQDILKIRLP